MSLIRFPLELPRVRRPKRETWRQVTLGGLTVVLVLLLLVYVIIPAIEYAQEHAQELIK